MVDAVSKGSSHERRLRVMVVLAAGVVLAVAWATVLLLLQQRRDEALEAEVRQNTNLARAFDEQTTRVLENVNHATLRLRDAVVKGGAAAPDLVRYASETGLTPKILVQLAWVDAKGRFMGSNIDPDGKKTGPVDLSEREHVMAHLNPSQMPAGTLNDFKADDLFIGKPVLGKVSKRWTIQLSRRIVGPDGALLGVVVASLDPGYFEEVFAKVRLGPSGSVTLVGEDLGVRARVLGGKGVEPGSKLAADGAFARRGKGEEGRILVTSTLDGVDRITVFHKLPGRPLYLLVGSALNDALADWYFTRKVMISLTVLLSVAVIAGAVIFLLSLRRFERDNLALRESQAKAQEANQAKSEFLAAMSHELRTPLTSIRGFAELMEQRLEDERFKRQAGLIRKGAEHLSKLVTEILDLSKVEAGAMQLDQETLDLPTLIEGTGDFFSLSASNKGLDLRVQMAPGLPLNFQGDALRLKQILNNLLSNAIKFTETGAITLSVEVQGDKLAFHVDDSGPGIPLEAQARIFEKFRQGGAHVSSEHGGTGLGLALSRGLAELMGGSLTVNSTPGQGSRFTLLLPLHGAPAAA